MCRKSPQPHGGSTVSRPCLSWKDLTEEEEGVALSALRGAKAWTQRKHLLLAVWLERVVDSFDELHLITDWIMTEERRIQDICLGNQEICGSVKAVNIRQVV